jgi:hypothetical protein
MKYEWKVGVNSKSNYIHVRENFRPKAYSLCSISMSRAHPCEMHTNQAPHYQHALILKST